MPEQPAPGQAAYEAYAAMVVPRPWRWDQLDGKLRAAWEAAHEAVAAPLNAELARLREEAASLREQVTAIQHGAGAVIRDTVARETAALREQLDRLRIGDTRLRARLDDLASQWEHEAAEALGELPMSGADSRAAGHANGLLVAARELREALEGGTHG